jgi:FAD/FMN-containing dehydrogenase/Fe-S oxidoreductase
MKLASPPPRPVPPRPDDRQLRELAYELSAQLEGEVRFDAGTLGVYATDASNYRQVPFGVVIPRHVDDVVAAVSACRRHRVPLLSRGGGTSLAGQCCNAAVVLDFSKYMHGIIELDPVRKIARVQPGVVLDTLRHAANAHDLTFAPDPSTHNHCTLGGMIGNNSCGVHSLLGGKTVENVIELEVLLYDGTRMRVGRTSDSELEAIIASGGRRGGIYAALRGLRDRTAAAVRARYPRIPRRVSGFNLDELLPENGFDVAKALVGSEGTCVVVLEATLRLVDWPKHRSLAVLGYPDVYRAGDHVPRVLEHHPIGLEGLDDRLLGDMRKLNMRTENLTLLPEGRGFLLVEFGGATKQEADDRARAMMDAVATGPNPPATALFDDPAQERMLWKVRESGLGATAHIPGEKITWEGWEDAAVPPERVGGYLRQFRALLDRYGYSCSLYGHFGQGCIHTRIEFDLASRDGIDHYRAFTREAAALVLAHGGSLSGEHGDGQSRGELLPMMFGEDLVGAFREFKSIWDPDWLMNPGKVVDPYRQDENLRLGTDYHPWRPETHFRFPRDGGDFAKTALRCVGVGECRKDGGGVMCPSYMVTREEEHSTRGRARLLFEMLRGEVITTGWRSPEVKHALDLCLACKGCKGECPVNVDMATYKAEFLSHHYQGRLRPRSAYAFGLIDRWARLAALAPGLVNWLGHAPGVRAIAKGLAGMAGRREVPRFARQTFVAWFRDRPVRSASGHRQRVLLWPDTFTNHFHPEIARDAVAVLEGAGCEVIIPGQHLCCGRPLYDYGFLDTAKRYLLRILEVLRPEIRAGTPLIGLEPSCLAVFRDELTGLLPFDEDAYRLSRQAFTLAEFLTKRLDGWRAPILDRPALVHGHCHHRAVMGLKAEEELFKSMGLAAEVPDHGCCGMAGSFGFEGTHYDVSVACGERALLPAVRALPAGKLLIADGFSCREQISQLTAARPLHTAQVLALAQTATAPGAGSTTTTEQS